MTDLSHQQITPPCPEAESLPGAVRWEQRRGTWWMDAPDLDVLAMAESMKAASARLSTISGIALEDGETEVIYHYALGAELLNFKVRVIDGELPSITPITPAADWIEREIQDLFAVTFSGHPEPGRLIRPPQLAAGFFRRPGGAAGKTSHQE